MTDENTLRITIEEQIRAEFEDRLVKDLEDQGERLNEEFEATELPELLAQQEEELREEFTTVDLPAHLVDYEEKCRENFEDEIGDLIEQRLQEYSESAEE
jgi:gamma-glutamyl phosphate reductase